MMATGHGILPPGFRVLLSAGTKRNAASAGSAPRSPVVDECGREPGTTSVVRRGSVGHVNQGGFQATRLMGEPWSG